MASELKADDAPAASNTGDEPRQSAPAGTAAKKKAVPKTAVKKSGTGRPRPSGPASRRRGPKPYPVVVFEEALKIPEGIMQHGSGEPIRRLTLLRLMDLNPSSQATRDLI